MLSSSLSGWCWEEGANMSHICEAGTRSTLLLTFAFSLNSLSLSVLNGSSQGCLCWATASYRHKNKLNKRHDTVQTNPRPQELYLRQLLFSVLLVYHLLLCLLKQHPYNFVVGHSDSFMPVSDPLTSPSLAAYTSFPRQSRVQFVSSNRLDYLLPTGEFQSDGQCSDAVKTRVERAWGWGGVRSCVI